MDTKFDHSCMFQTHFFVQKSYWNWAKFYWKILLECSKSYWTNLDLDWFLLNTIYECWQVYNKQFTLKALCQKVCDSSLIVKQLPAGLILTHIR